jgi:hypothetical protein
MLLEASDELRQRHSHSAADLPKFEQVEPAVTALVLADERLRPVEQLGKIFLAQTSSEPELSQQTLEALVVGREHAFVHNRAREPTLTLYAKSEYS